MCFYTNENLMSIPKTQLIEGDAEAPPSSWAPVEISTFCAKPLTDGGLNTLLSEAQPGSIVLLEDVDAAFNEQLVQKCHES
jgi:hypothetical protein